MAQAQSSSNIPPAEWEKHCAVWTAWPTGDDLWPPHAKHARLEVQAMIECLSEQVHERAGDKVKLLVKNDEAFESATKAVGDIAEIIRQEYGDIWLRDTGPIFLSAECAVRFGFNGWGEKYIYPHDTQVSEAVCRLAGAQSHIQDFILEGGAIDGDGQGNFLTTRQCLLNPNRNANWTSEHDAELALQNALGARKVIWLGDGLLNDHTDGHVDNVARFVGPSHVVCQEPNGVDDPNTDALNAIYDTLRSETDADGKLLTVTRIPSPGLYREFEGEIAPASHMNFLIGNSTIVMPTYGEASEEAAEEAIIILQNIFKDRQVVGLPSRYILTGGGSFHCITQQQPV